MTISVRSAIPTSIASIASITPITSIRSIRSIASITSITSIASITPIRSITPITSIRSITSITSIRSIASIASMVSNPDGHLIGVGAAAGDQCLAARIVGCPRRQTSLAQKILIIQPQFLEACLSHVGQFQFRLF